MAYLAKWSRLSWRAPQLYVLALTVVLLLCANAWALHQLSEKSKRAEIFATSSLSLIGTLVGAALAFWYAHSVFEEQEELQAERRQRDETFMEAENASRRVDRTLDMKRRFDSDPTYQARLDADEFLRDNPVEKLDTLYQAHSKNPKAHAVFLVISFYEQLSLSIRYNKVDLELTPSLFGQTFFWWYYVCFRAQLPRDWPSCNAINYLKDWLDHCPLQTDVKRWKGMANDERVKRLASPPNQSAPKSGIGAGHGDAAATPTRSSPAAST